MSSPPKVACQNCVHFRSRPYEAKFEGCYLEKNMPSKQKLLCLDEQQLPGNHVKINLRGDCPDHSARAKKPSLWRRLLAIGA
ncbi:MAG: hypothetical protein EXS08_16090 [Planctomycetes bacterium]|nr:hypothetical protein [Planctomycetota bacterium]